VATQANHGFVFKKRTIKQVMEEEKKAEKEAATLRLQAAGRGMLGRRKAKEEFDQRMEQVNAAIRVQSVVRRRLDQHKIDTLIQQRRVEEIISQKEIEERALKEEKVGASAAADGMFGLFGGLMGGANSTTTAAEAATSAKAGKKDKRIPFTELKKSDIPPDGKFWASGFFVYWSDKHNRPYFYNPEVDETQWFPPEEENEDDDDIVEFSDEEEDMDDGEKAEHQMALKKAKLKRLTSKEQHK
jgi:hypothetical protein